MNYKELKEKYPLTFSELERWFILLYDIPKAEVVVEENQVSITNGSFFIYLHMRDLYSFFDFVKVRPFILPCDFPNFKIAIQSSKSIKWFEDVYDSRYYAECIVFEKCFQYSEILFKHKKEKDNP